MACTAGSIGNAEWEGVLLRDVLAKAGLNVEDPDPKAKHVVIEVGQHACR